MTDDKMSLFRLLAILVLVLLTAGGACRCQRRFPPPAR